MTESEASVSTAGRLRFAGAGLRAIVATSALVPWMLLHEAKGGGPPAFIGVGLVAFFVFSLERRDQPLLQVPLRLGASAVLAGVTQALVAVWWKNVGDVTGSGYVSDLLRLDPGRLLLSALSAGLYAQPLGHLLYVRARSERLWPQLLAGFMTVAPLCVDAAFRDGTAALALASAGLCVPLGVGWCDRLAASYGLGGPLPPAEPGPRRVLSHLLIASVLLVALALMNGLLPAPASCLVSGTYPARVERTLELVFDDGRRLRATPTHPIATAAGTWTRAGDLRLGEPVCTRRGAARLERVIERGAATVHDLSVAPYPNFFGEGVLVHNKRSFRRESSAIATLRGVHAAQALFRESDGDGDRNFD